MSAVDLFNHPGITRPEAHLMTRAPGHQTKRRPPASRPDYRNSTHKEKSMNAAFVVSLKLVLGASHQPADVRAMHKDNQRRAQKGRRQDGSRVLDGPDESAEQPNY